MLHKSFNSAKCKTSLKLASARIKLLKNKRQQVVSQLRREISQLLEAGKDQTARIRVEHVIREEKTVAAYEFIELFCELIAARLQIIESQKACPIDLKEAIASVIFASQRCPDVTELSDVRKRLAAKYGKEFATAALELRPNCGVSSLMVEKLSVKTPDIETKLHVLTSIATEYGINWEPKSFEEQVKKTQDGRLDGPSSFGAVKSTTKPPEEEVQNPVTYSVSSSTSCSVPAKPSEKEVQSPATYSASFTSSSVPAKHQSEPRPSEPRYQSTQSENSYSRGMDDSSKLEQYNREFKDASSAARAAAESAERANLAARAAAEFASQETRIRQFATSHGETSQTPPEIASISKAENVQADLKDPGFNSNSMKETSKVSKSSEHHSSEVMHYDYRAKNKAKEDLEGPRRSSYMSKSPSPPSCDIDKLDPTLIVAGRSSLRITSEQVTKHGQSSSQMMQADIVEKYSTVSEDDEEDEEEEMSDDKFSNDRVGNSIHEEGIRTENIRDQSGSEKTKTTTFKPISSPSDGNIHSAGENWKNDFHGRENFDIYDEIGDQKDNQQGISTAVFDDYGPDDGECINVFEPSHDNVVELDLLKSKPADSSLHQDSWFCKDTKSESSIERHAPSHIFSPETTEAENGEEAMEDSPLKFNESPPPKYDEPLSAKYDEIDGYDNSDSEDDKWSRPEVGKSTSTTGVSFPGRQCSINLHSSLEDQIGHGLKLDSISGGFKNKGLVRPPYVRSSPDSPPSKERVDDPSDRTGHGRKKSHYPRQYSDFGRSEVDPQPQSYLEYASSDRLSGRYIYGEKSHDVDDHMKQGSKRSRQYSDFGNSNVNREPRDHFEHSSRDRLSGRHMDGKKSYDENDIEQGFNSSKQYSDFSSSKEDSQPHCHVASQRTRTGAQSCRTKGLLMSNSESRAISHQLDGESLDVFNQQDTQMETKPPQSRSSDVKSRWYGKNNSKTLQDEGAESLDMSNQQDTEAETKPLQSRFYDVKSRWDSKYSSKPLQDEGADLLDKSNQEQDTDAECKLPQSRSYDVKRRWNDKYNSKPLQDEDAESSRHMDGLSIKESSESSLHDFPCTVGVREETKTASRSELHSRAYEKVEAEISSQPAPKHTVLADPETPSESSDVRNRWNRKYSQPSEKHLAPQVQTDEFSGKELHASPSTVQTTVKGMPESLDRSPAKSVTRTRWSNKYPSSQPSEVPPAQRNESSKKELHVALPSTVEPGTKGIPGSLDGPPSKSDTRNRWSSKYSPSQPSEVPPAQREESSKKDLYAALPSTVQPGTPELSDSSKSDVQKRRSNKHTTSNPSEKNSVPPVHRNESPEKEFHAAPSAILPSAKGVPETLDFLSSKSDAQMRWNNKYVPPLPSEKYVAPPVQTDEVSRKESQALPPTVQLITKGMPGSPDGSVKKEKSESQSSRQHSSTQPEGAARFTAGSGAAGLQNVRSDVTSAASADGTESPRSPQMSADSPLPRVNNNKPQDYDTFAARFKALKANHRK